MGGQLSLKGLKPARKPKIKASSEPSIKSARSPALTLTAPQQQAVDGVLALGAGSVASIVGAAGTGKSTLLRAIIDSIPNAGLAAPTHSACRVVESKANRPCITVASLLGLKEERDGRERHFVPGNTNRLWESGIWIIDEASMIGQKLYDLILDLRDADQTIVFVGDASQLPPVGDKKISPALTTEPRFELTEVLRHDGGILDCATAIRKATGGPTISSSADGSVEILPSRKEWLERLLGEAGNPDEVKAITYRRIVRTELNTRIRRRIHGHLAPDFLAGEQLVSIDAIPHPTSPSALPLAGSNTPLLVKACRPKMELVSGPLSCEEVETWSLEVELPNGKRASIRTVVGSNRKVLDIILDELATAKAWGNFWRLKNSFAEVQHSHAVTCHTAQGGQVDTVFLDIGDMNRAPNASPLRMRQRLIYTGATRATQKIIAYEV